MAELDAILAANGHVLDVALQLRVERRATMTGRSDDTEEVIRHRLELYHREIEPVAAAYSRRGILLSVDGMGSEDETFARLLVALRASFPGAIPNGAAGS